METKIPVKDGAINLDEEVMCSILSERLRVRVWTPLRYTRDVKKENLLLLCQTWNTYSKNRGCVMHWYKNRRNSFPYTVRTFRQRLCNQRVSCLLGNQIQIDVKVKSSQYMEYITRTGNTNI